MAEQSKEQVVDQNRIIGQSDLFDQIVANLRINAAARYRFIIGAAASVSSGIISTEDLVSKWLNKLQNKHGESFELEYEEVNGGSKVKKKITLREANKNPAKYFASVRGKLFPSPEEGHHAILNEITKAKMSEPKTGWRLLARIMAHYPKQFNVIVTTNFDRLAENAITSVGKTPHVFSHNALAQLLKPNGITNPTVLKIHNDVTFQPLMTEEEVSRLSQEWERKLINIFGGSTIIVIGYGGFDQSLMNLLKDKVTSEIFWCSTNPENLRQKNSNAYEIVTQEEKSRIVRIEGFDSFMLELAKRLNFICLPMPTNNPPLLGQSLMLPRLKSSILREEPFEKLENVDEINQRDIEQDNKNKQDLEKVKKILKLSEEPQAVQNWWNQIEKDFSNNLVDILNLTIELLYIGATIADLYLSFFVSGTDNIESNFKALEFKSRMKKARHQLERQHNHGNQRWQKDIANSYFAQMSLHKDNIIKRIEYADVLIECDRLEEAQQQYERAVEIADEKDSQGVSHGVPALQCYALNSLALYFGIHNQNYNKEQEYYLAALKVDENNIEALNNYGISLWCIQNAFPQAKAHLKNAMNVEPNNAKTLSNYAYCLEIEARRSGLKIPVKTIVTAYNAALEAEPNNIRIRCDYARFLHVVAKVDQAERQYKFAKKAMVANNSVYQVSFCLYLCDYCILTNNLKEMSEWLEKLKGVKFIKRDKLVYHFFCLIQASLTGKSIEPSQRDLVQLLDTGIRRERWQLDHLLKVDHIKRMDKNTYQTITDLVKTINSPSSIGGPVPSQ